MSLITPVKGGAITVPTIDRKTHLEAADRGKGREEEARERGEEGRSETGEVEVEGSSGKEVVGVAANARGSPFRVSL